MLQVGEILHHDYEEGRPPSPERPTSPSMTFAAGMTAEVEGGEPQLKGSLMMGPDYTMPYTMQHRGATGERPPSPEAKLFQSRAAVSALPPPPHAFTTTRRGGRRAPSGRRAQA